MIIDQITVTLDCVTITVVDKENITVSIKTITEAV